MQWHIKSGKSASQTGLLSGQVRLLAVNGVKTRTTACLALPFLHALLFSDQSMSIMFLKNSLEKLLESQQNSGQKAYVMSFTTFQPGAQVLAQHHRERKSDLLPGHPEKLFKSSGIFRYLRQFDLMRSDEPYYIYCI